MKKKILVVEDEKNVRDGLVFGLHLKKFSTLEAVNGVEAVKVALSEHPDLILLDLLMPEMDGVTALKKIRDDAWGANVPVIILTNLSMNEEKLIEEIVPMKPLSYLIKVDWNFTAVADKVKEALTPH